MSFPDQIASIISVRLVLERQIFFFLILMVLQRKEECVEIHDCFNLSCTNIWSSSLQHIKLADDV